MEGEGEEQAEQDEQEHEKKREYFSIRKTSSIGKDRLHNPVEYQEGFTINKLPSAPKCNFVLAPPHART